MKCRYCGKEFTPDSCYTHAMAKFDVEDHEVHACDKRPMENKPPRKGYYHAKVSFIVEIPDTLTMKNFQHAKIDDPHGNDDVVDYMIDCDWFKTTWKIEKLPVPEISPDVVDLCESCSHAPRGINCLFRDGVVEFSGSRVVRCTNHTVSLMITRPG